MYLYIIPRNVRMVAGENGNPTRIIKVSEVNNGDSVELMYKDGMVKSQFVIMDLYVPCTKLYIKATNEYMMVPNSQVPKSERVELFDAGNETLRKAKDIDGIEDAIHNAFLGHFGRHSKLTYVGLYKQMKTRVLCGCLRRGKRKVQCAIIISDGDKLFCSGLYYNGLEIGEKNEELV